MIAEKLKRDDSKSKKKPDDVKPSGVRQARAEGGVKGAERVHGRTFPGSVIANPLEEP